MADSQVNVVASHIPTNLSIPHSIQEYVPNTPSPLNPDSATKQKNINAPTARNREPREKKDSLKKRESTLGTTNSASNTKREATSPSSPGAISSTTSTKRKFDDINGTCSVPSPMRYSISTPKISDYDIPRETTFASVETLPFLTPDGKIELKKPLDHAENKKGYRYNHCVADPLFKHKQYYRATDATPFGPRMSFEDADKWLCFDESGRFVGNEKGWRMGRGNVCAREGTSYFEMKIVRGGGGHRNTSQTNIENNHRNSAAGMNQDAGPKPHVRVGWARREASLDTPVGFDGFSYGVTDIRFETMHRSRSGKFYDLKNKKINEIEKRKSSTTLSSTTRTNDVNSILEIQQDVEEGDILGLEITLPSLSLHQKVVQGIYNPAVDTEHSSSDNTFDPTNPLNDVIRDRIPVPYKGGMFFEILDHIPTRGMEAYSDRTLTLSTLPSSSSSSTTSTSNPNSTVGAAGIVKQTPNPHHPDPSLRTLPGSSIRVFKNGKLVGTAFENLLAFLPPASQPKSGPGARKEAVDDGLVGYFPAVSCFCGGIVEMNFGNNQPSEKNIDGVEDGGGSWWMPPEDEQSMKVNVKAVGDRFKEQIAEDVVWDIVDEVDFFMQDGGFEGSGEISISDNINNNGNMVVDGLVNLKEEMDS